MWVRAQFAGGATRTVFIAVDAFGAMTSGAFSLTATATAPPVAAGGCGVGRFDLSQGGTVYATVQGQTGTLTGTCSPGGYATLGEQGYIYSGAARGARVTGSATGFRPLVTVRDAMNCGTERACAYSGANSSNLTTMVTGGAVVIDGIPNMPGTLYQYAVEVVPQ
jgi:hypothetical protein